MRAVVHSALRELSLDYAISSVSVGASYHYEIVLWDRPRNSYFSIRVHWETGLSRGRMTERVVQQLTGREAAWRAAHVRNFGQRTLRPYGPSSVFVGA